MKLSANLKTKIIDGLWEIHEARIKELTLKDDLYKVGIEITRLLVTEPVLKIIESIPDYILYIPKDRLLDYKEGRTTRSKYRTITIEDPVVIKKYFRLETDFEWFNSYKINIETLPAKLQKKIRDTYLKHEEATIISNGIYRDISRLINGYTTINKLIKDIPEAATIIEDNTNISCSNTSLEYKNRLQEITKGLKKVKK